MCGGVVESGAARDGVDFFEGECGCGVCFVEHVCDGSVDGECGQDVFRGELSFFGGECVRAFDAFDGKQRVFEKGVNAAQQVVVFSVFVTAVCRDAVDEAFRFFSVVAEEGVCLMFAVYFRNSNVWYLEESAFMGGVFDAVGEKFFECWFGVKTWLHSYSIKMGYLNLSLVVPW